MLCGKAGFKCSLTSPSPLGCKQKQLEAGGVCLVLSLPQGPSPPPSFPACPLQLAVYRPDVADSLNFSALSSLLRLKPLEILKGHKKRAASLGFNLTCLQDCCIQGTLFA